MPRNRSHLPLAAFASLVIGACGGATDSGSAETVAVSAEAGALDGVRFDVRRDPG